MSDETLRRVLSVYRPRNPKLVDVWSFVHLGTVALMALVVGPVVAFLLSALWEPLEVRVLSPLLAKRGIDFGHESLGNSLSDLAFDAAGAALGWALLRAAGWTPPLGF